MTQKPLIIYPDIDKLDRSLKRLDELATVPYEDSEDDPVFLVSTGWRTGSTLMQRILMTDPSLLMWGEPIDRAQFLSRITDGVSCVLEHWPALDQWISHRPNLDLSRDWVASLAPDSAYLKMGLRSMMDNWLGRPARDRGFSRWGVKEVRWSGHDGQVLRWLYPNSKFVVITRHPVSSFYSMMQFNLRPGWGLWDRWPDRFVDDLESYAAMWNILATSWTTVAERLGAKIVRYEEVIDGSYDLAVLGASLGLSLRPEIAVDTKAGGMDYIRPITAEERDRLNELTAPGRALLGYAE